MCNMAICWQSSLIQYPTLAIADVDVEANLYPLHTLIVFAARNGGGSSLTVTAESKCSIASR